MYFILNCWKNLGPDKGPGSWQKDQAQEGYPVPG